MNAILSEKNLELKIPANFLEVTNGLSVDGTRLVLGFFQFLSEQEVETSLCLAFDLQNYLGFFSPSADADFKEALNEAAQIGIILLFQDPNLEQRTYLLPGNATGQALLKALERDPALLATANQAKPLALPSRPNLFKLYEQNIGPLTPYTAELLKDASQTYSEDWIEDAIKEAIHYNVRSWRYIQAILYNWQEKGRRRSNEEDKRDPESFRKLYLEQKRDGGN